MMRTVHTRCLLVIAATVGLSSGHLQVHAQGVAINATHAPADTSAMLDVSSLTKGMLIPRMTQAQRKAIPLPATGLLVYQSDTLPGLYLNVGTPLSPSWAVFGAHPTSGNTPLGLDPLSANTSGVNNTAAGASALSVNTTGFANTAVGASTLSSNTTGFANTANAAGDENTATGSQSLALNTTGTFNTACGWDALQRNTTGYSNTACGEEALLSNTIGIENTATRSGALAECTSNGNTADGPGLLRGFWS